MRILRRKCNKKTVPKKIPKGNTLKSHSFVIANKNACAICNKGHPLFACPIFRKYSPQERYDKIDQLKICKFCLRDSSNDICTFKFKCRNCQKAHNNLLCFAFNEQKGQQTRDQNVQPSTSQVISEPIDSQTEARKVTLSCTKKEGNEILCSTAIVYIRTISNKWVRARALLDSASQSNFITEAMVSKLGAKQDPINASICGINGAVSALNKETKIEIASRFNEFQTLLNCLVISKITENIPAVTFGKANVNIPNHIKLADDNFNVSSEIHLLIGAAFFYELMSIG